MKSREVQNLSEKGISPVSGNGVRTVFANERVLTHCSTDSVKLFNIGTGMAKALPTQGDKAMFSPSNQLLGISRKDAVYVYQVKNGLANLSPADASFTFQIPGFLDWVFISDEVLLSLTTAGIEACSVKANQKKTFFAFSGVSNLPSFDGFESHSFMVAPDKKNFVSIGKQQGQPTTFIVSVTLNRVIRVVSGGVGFCYDNSRQNVCVLFAAQDTVNKVVLSASSPQKEQIRPFGNSSEQVLYLAADSTKNVMFVFSATRMAMVDLNRNAAVDTDTFAGTPVTSFFAPNNKLLVLTETGSILEVDTAATNKNESFETLGQTAAVSVGESGGSLEECLANGDIEGAVRAAVGDESRRSPETIELFKNASAPNEKVPPVVKYLVELVNRGRLEDFESVELARLFIVAKKTESKRFLAGWFKERKLTVSEQLGDVLKDCDLELAGKVYEEAGCHAKRVGTFLQLGNVEQVVPYARRVRFVPDYELLYSRFYRLSLPNLQEKAKLFAVHLIKEKELSVERVAEIMLENDDGDSYIDLMLRFFKQRGDNPADGVLQTRFLETVASRKPDMLPAVLESSEIVLTQFDREAIGSQLEAENKPHLALLVLQDEERLVHALTRALLQEDAQKHFDTKRLTSIFRTQMEKQRKPAAFLVRLLIQEDVSPFVTELVADSLNNLLREGLSADVLGVEELGLALQDHYAHKVLLAVFRPTITCKDFPKTVVFAYLQAAVETGEFKEAERVIKESDSYDPEKVKQYLLSSVLRDPRPLIFLCDKHGYLYELTRYLVQYDMQKFLFVYVQKVSPKSAAAVLEAMVKLSRPDTELRELINVTDFSQTDIARAAELLANSHKSELLTPALERAVKNGTASSALNTALVKLYVSENNPAAKEFMTRAQDLDFKDVGDFAQTRNPALALVAYARGKLDDDVLQLSNNNSLFLEQAEYLVSRKDEELWARVLAETNEFRSEVAGHVVNSVLSKETDVDRISAAVKAFIAANIPSMLINLLEKILLGSHNPVLARNRSMQNLLILTAIQCDKSRVQEYTSRLNNYDIEAIGKMAQQYGLFEEAVSIYEKAERLEEAFTIMLVNLHDVAGAKTFAEKKETEGNKRAMRLFAKAALQSSFVEEGLVAMRETKDTSLLREAVRAGKAAKKNELLLAYLLEVAPVCKDPLCANTVLMLLAELGRTEELAAFLAKHPRTAVERVAEDCFQEGYFRSAAVLYAHTGRSDRLVSCYVRLREFVEAAAVARKANTKPVWKELFGALLAEPESAELKPLLLEAGKVLVAAVDTLQFAVEALEDAQRPEVLLAVLEAVVRTGKANQSVHTQLCIAYCRHRPDVLERFVTETWHNILLAQAVRVLLDYCEYSAAVFLYLQGKQFDSALRLMVEHAPLCFSREYFEECLLRTLSVENFRTGLAFLFDCYPQHLLRVLPAVASKVDFRTLVKLAEERNCVFFIAEFLESLAETSNRPVADALCQFYIEEEATEALSRFVFGNEAVNKRRVATELETHPRKDFRTVAARLYFQIGNVAKALQLASENRLPLVLAELAGRSADVQKVRSTISEFVADGLKEFALVTLTAAIGWLPLSDMLYCLLLSDAQHLAAVLVLPAVKRLEEKVKELEQNTGNTSDKPRSDSLGAKKVAADRDLYVSKLALEGNKLNNKAGTNNTDNNPYGF